MRALAFVLRAGAEGSRILDVGCGDGALARALGGLGRQVTAIDTTLRDPTPAPGVTFVECDFLTFDAAPFDTILFGASLHHIAPLSAAIEHAAALVVRGGRLLADEFDLAAPDLATLRWYYAPEEGDLAARWQHDHEHDGPPLHTGDAMLAAIAARFNVVETRRGPYLHRKLEHERGVDRLLEEAHLIETGAIRPVGLRIVAERPLIS